MMQMIPLPPVRTDLRDIEKHAQISVDVLVNVTGFKTPCIGRYIHGIGEWQIDGFHGSYKVIEWWELPKAGTGHDVSPPIHVLRKEAITVTHEDAAKLKEILGD